MAFVLSRPGEYNSAGGDPIEFNLEKFSGMVLNKLDHRLILLDTITQRETMAGSKAAVFPTYGDASASHHKAGDDILAGTSPEGGNYLSEIAVGEHIIYADRKMQSSIFLDDLDKILNHWSHQEAFSGKLATSVAEKIEDKLFRQIAKGSGAGASAAEGKSITGWASTTRAYSNAGAAWTTQQIYDHIWQFSQRLEEENAETGSRFGAVPISIYFDLLRFSNTTGTVVSETVNMDFVKDGVNLSRPNLRGMWIGGVFVMPTNGIPTTDTDFNGTEWRIGDALGSADNNYDDVTMADVYEFFGWTPEAIGLAVASSPALDVNYIPERLGHLIVLHQSLGCGVIRPEYCYSIRRTA